MSRYRFPDGVSYEGEGDDGSAVFRVSIPVDEDGFFGRQCPVCDQGFRISDEDYDALPDDAHLWRVYCGHVDDHCEFLTDQQEERVMRAAGDYAEQLIGTALDDTFRSVARRSKGTISYRSKPFYPSPLPGIDEERLIRERTCPSSGTRYAVFGEHRFCPVCGPLPPLTVAEDAIAAEVTRLDALAELPPETLALLREQGVLDRTFVDTMENLVGVVEALADAIFRLAVPQADEVLKGKGNVFQRLEDTADLFDEHLGADLRKTLGADWPTLGKAWATRHVFTHNDGIVDSRYLAAVPDSWAREGQRLRLTESEVRTLITKVQSLCRAIAQDAQKDSQ